MHRKERLFSLFSVLFLILFSACTPSVVEVSPSPTPTQAQTPPSPTPVQTQSPSSPAPLEDLSQKYQSLLPSEFSNWGLGSTSLHLLLETISHYGHYPDGEEFLCWGWESQNYYLFDRPALDPEALAVAVLYMHPDGLTLDTVMADFASSLSYQEETPLGHPCYTTAIGDVEAWFLLEENSLWAVLLSLPEAELPSMDGVLRALEETAPLSPDLRTGLGWEVINAAVPALGKSLEDLYIDIPQLEPWAGQLGHYYYDDIYRDPETGFCYICQDDYPCSSVWIPASSAFPENKGIVSSSDFSSLLAVPYSYSYYEDYGYWLRFEDLSLCFQADFFTPSQDTDWVILLA